MSLHQPSFESEDLDYPYYEETVTESTWHSRVLNYLYYALQERYHQDQDVFVGANHFIYWEQGDRDKKQAPDIFICFGAPKIDRRSYRIWESGPPPQVVFEITSASTRLTDLGNKRCVYEMLGVEEYYLFDPLGEYIPRKLRGFRREQDILLPIAAEALHSPRLGLDLRVEDRLLRLVDASTGLALGTYHEEKDARLQAELELTAIQQRAEAESARAEAERARAERLAQRLRDLGVEPDPE